MGICTLHRTVAAKAQEEEEESEESEEESEEEHEEEHERGTDAGANRRERGGRRRKAAGANGDTEVDGNYRGSGFTFERYRQLVTSGVRELEERIERGDDAVIWRRRVQRRDVGGAIGGGRGADAAGAVGNLPRALDRRVFVRPPQLKLRVGEEALGEGIFAPFRHRCPPRASDDNSGGRETRAPPPLKNR